MRVLQLHCRYTRPGGEDTVVEAEAALLRANGHDVVTLYASNAEITAQGFPSACRALLASAWNRESYRRARRAIREARPDVLHVHNFWFALSPSVLGAARAEGVPVVMTLHNYRLVCPNALLMRGGTPCEVCLGSSPWKGVARRCYHGSAAQTALVARVIDSNRRRGTWLRFVDAYIALTGFSRDKLIAGGLPPERVLVKPNFLECDPGPAAEPGVGALFVGRLSPEKGVDVLLEAWRHAGGAELVIAGDGPGRADVESRAAGVAGVGFVGPLAHATALERIRRAAFLVLPSLCYETFGMSIVEAFACGRPVVASRLGAMAAIVMDGETGLLFEPGKARDLAEKARLLLENPAERERMGRAARTEFLEKYSAEANYPVLMSIYERATARARTGKGR